MNNILVIDDEVSIGLLLKKFLTKQGYNVFTCENGKSALKIIKENAINLILCDFNLPDYSGLDIIERVKIINPEITIIIITGYSDVRIAVQSLKKGAMDYVTKPLQQDEILALVKKALERDEEKQDFVKEIPRSKKAQLDSGYIRARSEQSKSVDKHIRLIAPTEMSVIITGETGTGKEFVAREIHISSTRNNAPFIALDCGALHGEIAGSELFGHVKGAFTGAVSDKKGCFELANKGTLFLDEIGNLSYENQMKLLRVLQERKLRRVGDEKEKKIDVRLLVATNEDLKESVSKGSFREDLFHRINEFNIELSPIRERPQDIEFFAMHFLNQSNTELDKNVKGFKSEVMDKLKQYRWHGNLRELKNLVKRCVLLTEGERISQECLPSEILNYKLGDYDEGDISGLRFPVSLKDAARIAEKKAIEITLEKTNGNKTLAAKYLGVDRKTLYNKIDLFNL